MRYPYGRQAEWSDGGFNPPQQRSTVKKVERAASFTAAIPAAEKRLQARQRDSGDGRPQEQQGTSHLTSPPVWYVDNLHDGFQCWTIQEWTRQEEDRTFEEHVAKGHCTKMLRVDVNSHGLSNEALKQSINQNQRKFTEGVSAMISRNGSNSREDTSNKTTVQFPLNWYRGCQLRKQLALLLPTTES